MKPDGVFRAHLLTAEATYTPIIVDYPLLVFDLDGIGRAHLLALSALTAIITYMNRL